MADIKKIRVQNVDYDIVDAGAARIEDIPVGEIDIELTETSISDGNVTLDISGKQDQLTAGKNIKIIDNVISAEGGGTISSLITPITYVKLKELRNAGKLIPGMQYRITDYSTETAQAETQSAGHNFNIIVTADSETTLNENARAFPAAREFRSYLDPNDEDYFLQPVIFYKQFIDDIGDYGEEEVQNHSSKAISFVDYYSENGKYFLVADDPYGDWSGDEYEYIDIFNLAGKNFGRWLKHDSNEQPDSPYLNNIYVLMNVAADSNGLYWTDTSIELISLINEPTEDNPIPILFTQEIDDGGNQILYNAEDEGNETCHNDFFVTYEIKGNQCFLYKTKLGEYDADDPDYNEHFIWYDRFTLDGIVYDRWAKVESDPWSDLPYFIIYDTFALTEVITNIIEAKDTYFSKSNLNAWELKYCLDNDTNRFAWAKPASIKAIKVHEYSGEDNIYIHTRYPDGDEEGRFAWAYVYNSNNDTTFDDVDLDDYDPEDLGYTDTENIIPGVTIFEYDGYEAPVISIREDNDGGKGVIYYMKDEWNNECPYDFKNIMFKRYKVTDATENGILADLDGRYLGYLGEMCNLFIEDENDFIWAYTFNALDSNGQCFDCSVECPINLSGKYADSEELRVRNNLIESYFEKVSVDDNALIAKQVLNNITFQMLDLDEGGITIKENIIRSECYNISFLVATACCIDSYCFDIIAGNYFMNNTFGNGCNSNTFDSYYYDNIFGKECTYNTFGYNCYSNIFGNNCNENIFGNHCSYNIFGNNCNNNTFGNEFNYNTLNNHCSYNTLVVSNARYNVFENGVKYIDLESNTSDSKPLQNITIRQGVHGTETNQLVITEERNLDHDVTYRANGAVDKILD